MTMNSEKTNSHVKERKSTLLIVDDTPSALKVLVEYLRKLNFEVQVARDGEEALERVAYAPPELILLDVMMPKMGGLETCRRLKADNNTSDIPVIFMSALGDTLDKVKGFKMGAVDYITKPFHHREVLARVTAHLTLKRQAELLRASEINLEKQVRERTAALEDANRQLQREISERKRIEAERERNARELKQSLVNTIQAIVIALEKRDPYTAGHQQRVSELAAAIAVEMDLNADLIEGIRLGGSIHDIGKIYVPAEFLCRPGRLNSVEMDVIKTHPQVGYEVLKMMTFPWPLAKMVWQHHERMDGSGYPRGLKGCEILLEARILGVADVVEAIASHRPYRPALGIERALQEISRERGKWYDLDVVDACLRLFKSTSYQIPVFDSQWAGRMQKNEEK